MPEFYLASKFHFHGVHMTFSNIVHDAHGPRFSQQGIIDTKYVYPLLLLVTYALIRGQKSSFAPSG